MFPEVSIHRTAPLPATDERSDEDTFPPLTVAEEVRRARLARVDAVAQRIHAETGGRRFKDCAPLIREDRAA